MREGEEDFEKVRKIRVQKPTIAEISGFGEAQGYGVHAIAQAGGRGAVVEYVTQVGIAETARDGGADHAEAGIAGFQNIFFGDGLPETGPAGAGFKLCRGIEERGVAADAAENAGRVDI